MAEYPLRPRSTRPGGGSWIGRLFIVPHVIVGVGLIGWAVLTLLWIVAGQDVRGRVVTAERHTTRRGVVSYSVGCAYPSRSGERHASTSVSESYFDGLPWQVRQPSRTGGETAVAPITVRVLEVGPLHHAVALPNRWSRWSHPGVVLGIAAFWNAVVSVFVYRDWVLPLRRNRADP
jgi:hypothetical protein